MKIIGKEEFKGAICCIKSPIIDGLTISANSKLERFLLFTLDKTSRTFLRSLIGILSSNNIFITEASVFNGIIFGTVDDTS